MPNQVSGSPLQIASTSWKSLVEHERLHCRGYDHVGMGGYGSLAPGTVAVHNGADDNASGTAGMLVLAEKYARSRSNGRSIIFIAFNGEEEGLLGSSALVAEKGFPLDRIAAMAPPDRAMGERLHAIIRTSAPGLSPKTWYGMPAYANADGKVVCFFQSAQKFKSRYATLGFSDEARLDEGSMWPTSFALKTLGAPEEAKIIAMDEPISAGVMSDPLVVVPATTQSIPIISTESSVGESRATTYSAASASEWFWRRWVSRGGT